MDEKFAALKKYNFWDGNIPALGYLRTKTKIYIYASAQ